MVDIVKSEHGNVPIRYRDSGTGADGFPSYAEVVAAELAGPAGAAIAGPVGSPTADAITVQGGALSNKSTAAYAASLVVKAAAGTLKKLSGFNSHAAPQWIQLHDAAALPANGAVPVAILYVGAQSNFSFDYGLEGRTFATGIVVCNSTTGPTKTIGAADCFFDAQYN